ncbi:FAD binding domain-containing protein [Ceratobasidium theobromae]|uniref:FAD binding domain-containing protein n=1 Tax=Ceratobasidium theobromae TaxID=1582974 RepID=A0A5N5QA74_9AGAM|nr:FAD binding domain-containing protein [Ceratobasidium theobromae]
MPLVDQTALDRLRASLSPSATVNLPGEPGYSIKHWALNVERPAAVVACPATAEDVVQILTFAQGKAPYKSQQKLHLTVKVCTIIHVPGPVNPSI